MTMGALVYTLCALTAFACSVFLLRAHQRTRTPLLLWSGLSFVAWAANNATMFADLVLFPGADLSLVRAILALVAITLLLYGLIGEAA